MSSTAVETHPIAAHDTSGLPSSQTHQALQTDTTVANGDSSPPEAPMSSKSKVQIAVVMSCLCACVFVAALDVTIVTTALPTISHQFDSTTGYTWIGTSFTLAHTASTPSWGKLSDIWGRKSVLLWANAIFFAGSLMCALVGEMDAFIAGRAVQGLGAGGMLAVVNICISDLFSQRDRGFYFGLTSVVWALASGVGPVLGGVFTSKLSWRWCFWINLPITGAIFPVLFVVLRLPNPKTPIRAGLKAIDWTGSLLIIGGAVMLLLGLHLGGVHDPWNSATVVCLVVFGVLSGALFVLNEWKLAVYPIIPVYLFRGRSSAASYGVCFFHAFAFMGVAYYLPLYFQAVLGALPLMSGVYLLPFIVTSSIVAALVGVFIQWTGKYLPTIWAGLAMMTLGIGLLINLDMDTNWVKLAIFQLIGGAGFGMSIEGPLLAAQAAVSASDVGTVTATMSFIRSMSTAIAIVIGGVIFQNEMGSKRAMLESELGSDIARLLDGGSAAANVDVVKTLPENLRRIAKQAFYESTRSMWILYVSFAAAGLLLSTLIRGYELKTEHEITQVGLNTIPDKLQRNNGRVLGNGGDDQPITSSAAHTQPN